MPRRVTSLRLATALRAVVLFFGIGFDNYIDVLMNESETLGYTTHHVAVRAGATSRMDSSFALPGVGVAIRRAFGALPRVHQDGGDSNAQKLRSVWRDVSSGASGVAYARDHVQRGCGLGRTGWCPRSRTRHRRQHRTGRTERRRGGSRLRSMRRECPAAVNIRIGKTPAFKNVSTYSDEGALAYHGGGLVGGGQPVRVPVARISRRGPL